MNKSKIFKINLRGECMKKMIFGCALFIGGLLGLLLFPITARQGPWALNGDILSVSMLAFALMLTVGFVICIYEVYVRK
jgi:hypothetical protein